MAQLRYLAVTASQPAKKAMLLSGNMSVEKVDADGLSAPAPKVEEPTTYYTP
ncbi:MAG: hypothetical protein R3C26_19390 [Calditrichia bacterium]